ncbi:MAG: response regulator [Gemmatimonadota bacterium]|jgi:CheY-like chemotaxis protein
MARILVVDDDEGQRLLLEEFIKSAGHDVLFASDGRKALALYRGIEVDAVVTDLAMPRFNGLRLIRELREEHGEERIVAISGVAADQLLLAEDLGAVAILKKPVRKDIFLGVLAKVLSEERRGVDRWRGR